MMPGEREAERATNPRHILKQSVMRQWRRDMVTRLILAALIVAFHTMPAVEAQRRSQGDETKKVPGQYTGNWVCQTSLPGYNILLPSADPSQPMTNKSTTPPTVNVVKFSLKADGTYETATAKGRYSFDSATKAVTWLDGPHKETFTKTQLSNRKDGAPSIGFVLNKRYYGCLMPK